MAGLALLRVASGVGMPKISLYTIRFGKRFPKLGKIRKSFRTFLSDLVYPSSTPAALALLPPEVTAMICRHLPCASLVALEISCSALRRALARWEPRPSIVSPCRAGVWGAKARRTERASPYSCTTGMLEVTRERGTEDQRVFKVILGVRKLIKTYGRNYILEARGITMPPYWDPFRDVPMPQRLQASQNGKTFVAMARQAFVSKKVLQIKAWRPANLDDGTVDGRHGRRLAEELLTGGEEVQVAVVLARLSDEAGRRFAYEVEEARDGVAREIAETI